MSNHSKPEISNLHHLQNPAYKAIAKQHCELPQYYVECRNTSTKARRSVNNALFLGRQILTITSSLAYSRREA